MIKIFKYFSVFWISLKVAQAKILVSVLNGRDEDKFVSIEKYPNFPSEEEIDKFGHLAVEKHLEE